MFDSIHCLSNPKIRHGSLESHANAVGSCRAAESPVNLDRATEYLKKAVAGSAFRSIQYRDKRCGELEHSGVSGPAG